MFDSLRNEFLNEFGGPSPRTYIDDLIAKGISFTNCHSAAPFTVVSMASKMTGCFPTLNKLDGWLKKDPTKTLDERCIRISEIMQYNGYTTHFMINEKCGIYANPVGFDNYFSQNVGYENFPYADYHKSSAPRFVLIQMADLHDECCLSSGHYFKKDYIDSYVRQSEKVKLVVENLKTGNDMIIITSDHGIRCIDDFVGTRYKDELTTGKYLTEKTTHNSFNIIWEGNLKPAKYDNLCRSVDMYPTIVDILGFEYPILDGQSLKPILSGKPVDIKYTYTLTGYSMSHPDRPGAWCVKDGRYKLVIYETKYGLRKKVSSFLYDYLSDKEEENDLSEVMPEKKAELKKEADRIFFSQRNIEELYKSCNFDYRKYLNFREKRENPEVMDFVASIIKNEWQGGTRKRFLIGYRKARLKSILYWQARPIFNILKCMGIITPDVV